MPQTKQFIKLRKSVKSQYLGKKVPIKFRNRYGKRYGESDVKSVAYAIAKSKKIRIHKRVL